MSALDDLKDRIDSAIYTNTEQNITGDGLQTVLDDMVDTMGVSVSQNTLKIGGTDVGELGGQLIENPEWVKVATDRDDKILYGVKIDGKFYFGNGCPPQVKEYVQNIINGLSLDEYENIVDFLNGLEEGDENLQKLLNEKVDKEDDKSLIDAEFASSQSVIENPQYLEITTDEKDKLIESTDIEGKKHFHTDVRMDKRLDVNEVSSKKINLNGSELSPASTIETTKIIDDPERRMEISTDAEGKILSYRDINGVKHEEVGVDTNHLNLSKSGMTEFQQALKDSGFNLQTPIDWSDKQYIYIPTEPTCAVINITGINELPQYKGVNSHAWMEVWDKNGNYFKKRVILDAQGRSSLEQAKKNFAADFCEDEWEGDKTTTIKIGDWVSQDSFHFKAYYTDLFKMANIVSYKLWENFKNTMPFNDNKPYKEYYATDYSSTSSSDKDFTQNTKDEAKCVPAGFPVIVYLNGEFYGLFTWQLKKHRDNYFLDRNATDNIHLDSESYTSLFNGNVIWTNTEIRNPKPKKSKWTLLCMDGSKYDGDNPKEIIDNTSEHWDGTNISCVKSAETKANILAVSQYMSEINALKVISTPDEDITLDSYAGTWNETDNFGKGVWISDGDSYYMSLHTSNTNHPISSDAYWIDITTNINNIKTEINKRFGVKWMIDYAILINLERNGDSIIQNTQWITWGTLNGKMKWYPCPYDLDASFGINSTTSFAFGEPGYSAIGATAATPIRYVYDFFFNELNTRWKELRDNKIIDKETFIRMLKEWIDDIGNDNLSMEYDKWSESPCNRDASISNKWEMTGNVYISYSATNTWYAEGVFGLNVMKKYNNRCYRSLQANNSNHRPDISPEWWKDVTVKVGNYAEGDVIYDGYNNFYEFRAKEVITVSEDSNSTNRQDHLVNTPFTKLYNLYPNEGGVYESIYRIYKWVSEQIALMDSVFNYNQNN